MTVAMLLGPLVAGSAWDVLTPIELELQHLAAMLHDRPTRTRCRRARRRYNALRRELRLWPWRRLLHVERAEVVRLFGPRRARA